MSWFKNLNATPRLMCSFGILIVLSLSISALGIYNLSSANDRIGTLFNADMTGSQYVNQIAMDRLYLARESRQAILHIQDAALIDGYQRISSLVFEGTVDLVESLGRCVRRANASAWLAIAVLCVPTGFPSSEVSNRSPPGFATLTASKRVVASWSGRGDHPRSSFPVAR